MGLDRTTYHSILIDYASGALDEAHALLIATHLSMSPEARKIVAGYETLGGGLLSDCCAPVAMNKNSLESVMDRLDDCAKEEECKKIHAKLGCPEGKKLPQCLQGYMKDRDSLSWTQKEPGLQTIHVTTKTCGAKASLLRVEAGFVMRPAHLKSYDLLLVLDGAFSEGERAYARGEIHAEGNLHKITLHADQQNGCLILTVTPSCHQSLLQRLRRIFR